MKTFELPVGQSQRWVKVKPGQQTGTFKLYASGRRQDWIDHENFTSIDIPPGNLLGIIKVRDETDFDFEGTEAFTGQDLQSLAAQIIRHPAFKSST